MQKNTVLSYRGLAVCALVLLAFIPFFAFAQSPADDDDEDEDDRSSRFERYRSGSSRDYGYSSSVRRKVNELDDDPVEEFPIPILLGLSLRQITPDFGDPRGGGTREHEGQDLIAPRGAYIVSPTEAVVTRVGTGESAGKYVYTANPGGETFRYMHLDSIAEDLSAGDELEPGDLIGYVGNTGNASGGVTHLHFEVRPNNRATDPYERFEGEFTLKERMEAITEILKDSDDEDEEAAALVQNYRALFVAAQIEGRKVPKVIADLIGTTAVTPGATIGAFVRDLTLGSGGADVIALQTRLIAADKGAAAKALAAAGATGYFGAMTQSALAEYQAAVSITPSVGYFGVLTRAHFNTN